MPRTSVEDLRRGEIADAAIRVIGRDGYTAVTMRGLAAELGVSTGTITHWFATKDEVLAAALDVIAERVERRIDRALDGVDDPREVLLALAEASVPEGPDAVGEQRVWVEISARAACAPELARRHARLYDGWRRRIERAVEAGIASGAFRPVDAAAWSRVYAALLDGLALHVLLHPRSLAPGAMREAVRDHLAATLEPPARRGRAGAVAFA